MQPLIQMEVNVTIALVVINHHVHDGLIKAQSQTAGYQQHHAAMYDTVSQQTPDPGNAWQGFQMILALCQKSVLEHIVGKKMSSNQPPQCVSHCDPF